MSGAFETSLGVATIVLSALLASACAEPEEAERASASESMETESEGEDVDVDVDAILAEAMAFETSLLQLSEEAEREETHADAAAVIVWGNAEVADDFLSIDPDDPTQALTFDPGTMFVKQHLDEAGNTRGLTLMYKAEPGYDPDSGDWFWARVDGETVSDAGKVAWCRNCHAAAENTDFVVGFGKSP